MKQYNELCRILKQELGVAPAPESTAQFVQIKQNSLRGEPAAPQISMTNFPDYHTPFIGYKVELAQIAARLNDPTCRLLTLLGPGGAGKTRLAVQAAQENSGSFADGAVFVPLAGLSSADWMAEAIAYAVDRPVNRSNQNVSAGRQDQLHALNDWTLLLILDHYEHLLPSVEAVIQILQTAPGVKLMVTSRQPLGQEAEWLLDIPGLSFPSQDLVPEVHTFDAVRLFAQAAPQLPIKFTLSAQTLPAVARICRLVQGNPLAVELAAAWLESSSPSQIAAQIAIELDSLAACKPEVPVRQRGARAVFNKTWEKLSAAERVALQSASVFRGGFDLQAARAVLVENETGANGEELGTRLAALVEKSLLLEAGARRFDLHPLVCQYAAERLEADPTAQQRMERRHANFFTTRLQGLEQAALGEQADMAAAALRDLDNLRLAWGWAVSHAEAAALGRSLEGLARFYALRDLAEEGEAAFQAAVDAIRPLAELENPGGERQALLARLLAHLGDFQARLGKS